MVLKQVKPFEELITAKEETHIVPKREGVSPAKRRSVKRMMLNCFVEYISSVFCFRYPSSAAVFFFFFEGIVEVMSKPIELQIFPRFFY